LVGWSEVRTGGRRRICVAMVMAVFLAPKALLAGVVPRLEPNPKNVSLIVQVTESERAATCAVLPPREAV
jgi:hypothetical protein